ncbi:Flp pilus assembly complex ATPase component TadA [Candidatus Woesearchaeota archaeon]|nr:Flp pilus assembly complex ATPase component TadA [Candidatus Woesearchaeota archaeon]
MEEKSYVMDTSVVIEGIPSQYLNSKKISGKIIIPKAVLAELEHQANQGQEIGFLGLEELQKLQLLSKQGKIELSYVGERPNLYQITNAKSGGEIDALIRDIAYNENAILISADKIQSEAAKALGVEVIYYHRQELKEKLQIEAYFDSTTMSVHLKESCNPKAKKGKPGEWKLLDLSNTPLKQSEVQDYAKEIVERSRIEPNAFIEISRPGSTIVQYKDYRIVIAKPPVSDGWEITAVKPIKVLNIEDYKLPEKISERIKLKARGVVIAGTTGSGKSTFCQSLAEYYSKNNFVTKTIESPRSLILSKDITQYSKNLATEDEIHDILFLSRPDYIVFDEMRNTPDFALYTDLRLGGSNVLGVLHAATPIDAIQRFISRLDVGMIPSVLDTLIFIENGNVGKIMTVQMIVKVPSGMQEADLARPVVEVKDFNTNKLEFEIYSYGEETIVIPVQEEFVHDPTKLLAAKQIEKELLNYVDKLKVKVIGSNQAEIYIPEKDIARVIGKEGKTIDQIEKSLGIRITVKELESVKIKTENENINKQPIRYKVEETKKAIVFRLPQEYSGTSAEIYVDNHFLLTYTVGKKAEIKINKKSKLGQELSRDLNINKEIEIKI